MIRTLRDWAVSVLLEAGAIRECVEEAKLDDEIAFLRTETYLRDIAPRFAGLDGIRSVFNQGMFQKSWWSIHVHCCGFALAHANILRNGIGPKPVMVEIGLKAKK